MIIEIAPKLVPAFEPPRGAVRYRAFHGGRGGGKSLGVAEMAALWGYVEPLRVLCAREFQNSIKESFHQELKTAIEKYDFLSSFYDVGVDYLRAPNGTEFLFKGLRYSANTLKSTAQVDLTIVEEAETIPEASWLALEATVFRRPKSELWALWNPGAIGSPVDKRFRSSNSYKNAIVTEINWRDNPWFPEALNDLRLQQMRMLDPNTYHHIWDGGYLLNSDKQVYGGKWEIMSFEPRSHWDGPYYGGDFGFANDPTAVVKCWIADECLLVEYEAGRSHLELDDTAGFINERIPGFVDATSYWDSARPESISYLRRHGLAHVQAVTKWPGSVKDGIDHIRSFKKIIVHPRCVKTAEEMRLYSYKTDRITNDVLTDVIDANNHYLDAMRYAIGRMIKRGKNAAMLFSSTVAG